MSNPSNLCIMQGTVNSVSPCYKKGTSELIYIEFELKVPRNYLNKGEKKYDFPCIRYAKEDVYKYKDLQIGDRISIVGSYKSEFYDYNGKTVKKQIFLAETVEIKKSPNDENEQLELPY